MSQLDDFMATIPGQFQFVTAVCNERVKKVANLIKIQSLIVVLLLHDS